MKHLLVCALAACATATPSLEAEADRLRREGRLGESYGAYAEALCGAPARYDLARRFVEQWQALGQPGKPEQRLTRCDVPEATLAYIQGLALGAGGDGPGADRALARAEQLAPAEVVPEIAYRRGLVALGAEQAAEALEHLGRAAALSPERPDVRIALAQAFAKGGQPGRVASELRAALAGGPSRQEIERGRQVLRAAVRASEPPLPAGVEATVAAGLAALEQRQLTQPELAQVLALAEQLSHPRLLTVAGLAELTIGAEGEGARLLNMAARISPLDPEPLRLLGLAYHSAERRSESLPPLREAFVRDPLDAETARMLAQAAGAAGDVATARDCWAALAVLEPGEADNHLALARAERQLGRPEAAERAVDRAYRIDGRSIPTLVERAVIQAMLARTAATEGERRAAADRTRDTVGQLLDVAPDHPGAKPIIESLKR